MPLSSEVGDEFGARLGIPGIAAHRAIFGDGPVAGKTILVQGVLGAVGSLAAQLARWGDATVIGTVVRESDLDQAREGALSIPIADPLPLDQIAEAHDRVDAGPRERVLLAVPR